MSEKNNKQLEEELLKVVEQFIKHFEAVDKEKKDDYSSTNSQRHTE